MEIVSNSEMSNASDSNKKKYTLLYVDDEESNLRIFRMAFKREYKILTALGGEEALEVLRNNNVQCIITDQKMPNMTGTELLEKVLPEFPNIIRMILTGFADIEAIVKAVNKCGIYKYITKPWDKGEMKFTIDKALETYDLKNEKNELIKKLEEVNSGLENMVEQRTVELEEVNKRLMDSISYAKTIQNAMLVSPDIIKDSFQDFFLIFKPLDTVSGDFYWHAEIKNSNGQYTILANIDCTGHGVSGALMSMIGESLLNQIVYEYETIESDEILDNLNVGVQDILNQQFNDNNHGMDASIIVINKQASNVCFSGAKQNLFYSKENKLEVIKGDRHSIGGHTGNEKYFSKHEINYTPGKTSFYMCSDGFQDQFGGEDNKKYSCTRMKECIESALHLPLSEQKNVLEKSFIGWMGKEKQTDDVIVIGVKI